MSVYSHSRLSYFEQCPLKYKLKYIDKVEAKLEESIEAFLGSRVHEVLEKLYRDQQNQKENSIEDLYQYLQEIWNKTWNNGIVFSNKQYKPEHYLKKAKKFLKDYYLRYYPFNQERTLGLEERILIDLDNKGEYKIQGYIDRLTETQDNHYEIHDYKTTARLPKQSELDNDRQLGLYSVGIKKNFSDVKNIDLVWHFLAFDKEMRSKRTDQELDKLKNQTIELINIIEESEDFQASPSYLCNWCEYKPVCYEWAHLYKLENKPSNIYLSDPGVKLVNTYVEIQKRKKKINDEIENQLSQIKEAIINFANKEKVNTVFGSAFKIKVNVSKKFSFPTKNNKDREELNRIIKQAGKWEEVSELDVYALARSLNEGKWSEDLLNQIKEFQNIDTIERIYMSKIKNNDE